MLLRGDLHSTMSDASASVCILHPADPIGVIPGGIDTFIRGILRWAPHDLDMRLVGVTTNATERPPGRWVECNTGRRRFDFYPVMALKNAGRKHRIPLTLRYALAMLARHPTIDADVLEFHRIEPALTFMRDARPKNLFMHQNMRILWNNQSDIRWRHLPSLYFRLEDLLLPRMSSIFAVREDAAKAYAERFPRLAERVHFTPTWMDPDIFYPVGDAERIDQRRALNRKFGFLDTDQLLVTVGRLDTQKDPHLLLDAYRNVLARNPEARLIFVGDGVLRPDVEDRIRAHGLGGQVVLAGLQPPGDVARLLQAADLFVLSSAYEGMPMSVLEALGTGLPVATTQVGEVGRVVHSGLNGTIATGRTPAELAEAIQRCLDNLDRFRGTPCTRAVEDYTPAKVLAPIYENYRRLANHGRAVRRHRLPHHQGKHA